MLVPTYGGASAGTFILTILIEKPGLLFVWTLASRGVLPPEKRAFWPLGIYDSNRNGVILSSMTQTEMV